MNAFDRMRARLQARVLIDRDLRLTDAGRAHTSTILAKLRNTQAPSDPHARGVRWDHHFKQRKR
ncbi:MAG: hypothetical protein VX072_06920 [Pseudomonadota bacterium]|nr:hypothetical protein [Pseudomonadota bacterium]